MGVNVVEGSIRKRKFTHISFGDGATVPKALTSQRDVCVGYVDAGCQGAVFRELQ